MTNPRAGSGLHPCLHLCFRRRFRLSRSRGSLTAWDFLKHGANRCRENGNSTETSQPGPFREPPRGSRGDCHYDATGKVFRANEQGNHEMMETSGRIALMQQAWNNYLAQGSGTRSAPHTQFTQQGHTHTRTHAHTHTQTHEHKHFP